MPINTTEMSSKANPPPCIKLASPHFHSHATQVKDTLHANGGLLSYEQTPVPYLIVTAGVGMQMRIGSSSICKTSSEKTRIQYIGWHGLTARRINRMSSTRQASQQEVLAPGRTS